MNKKITYSVWIVLLLITAFSLFFSYYRLSKQNLSDNDSFMDTVYQCPDDTSTSDRFVCLSNLADKTTKEADALADKLITQAPIRLNEISKNDTGPISFVYGGKDFLINLPIQVKKAREVKDEYINSICNLASMKIYGGSGMDLEQNACKYLFTEDYLQVLKNLEAGLNVKE